MQLSVCVCVTKRSVLVKLGFRIQYVKLCLRLKKKTNKKLAHSLCSRLQRKKNPNVFHECSVYNDLLLLQAHRLFFSLNSQTVKILDHLHSTPLGHSGILSAYFCPPSCCSAKRPL